MADALDRRPKTWHAAFWESVIEPALPNCTEVAVVVARDQHGDMSAFPPVTMEFDETLNAVSAIVSPGVLKPAEQTKCLQIALDAVGALDAIGVFAVELFISTSGELDIFLDVRTAGRVSRLYLSHPAPDGLAKLSRAP